MMDYPFYRNYYYPTTEVPAPVRRETMPVRKVIHVPVMDGSEKRSRSRFDSAVMIQKVLRGFLVRKSVKKIAAIKTEVNEMENRIMSEETMELIRKDSKERLKINELLMRLLLKLDSVRGVDSGVRDCRKTVIKKAIRLQEVVDSIADQTLDQAPEFEGTLSESDRNPNSNPISNSNAVDQLQNNCESEAGEDIPEAIDVATRRNVELDAPEVEAAKSASESNSNSNFLENNADRNLELQLNVDSVPETHGNEEAVNESVADDAPEVEGNFAKSAYETNSNPNYNVDSKLELQYNVQSVPESHGNEDAEAFNEYAENMDLSQDESQTGSSANPESLIVEDENEGTDSDTSEKQENGDEIEKDEAKEGNNRKNIQLLEKLVEENEKMMGLMADLFKKNEMQTQLLSSLSSRVEHLERALMCEKFRRKKKRNGTC